MENDLQILQGRLRNNVAVASKSVTKARDTQDKDGADDFDAAQRGKVLLKPDDQLDLLEKVNTVLKVVSCLPIKLIQTEL